MTKPPSKSKSEPPPSPSGSETAASRAKTPVAKPTMLEHLFANSQAFSDDEIKVWVQATLPQHPQEFFDSLTKYLDNNEVFTGFHNVLQVNETAPLPPGQHFLLFQATNLNYIRVELCQASPRLPLLVFRDVSFTLYHACQDYYGLEIGSSRPLIAAAKRAVQDTGGEDWFGGIGAFAAKYLEPPRPRKQIVH